MSSATAKRRQPYSGPAILSGGFRPMFLLGALWAVVAMVLWLLVLTIGFDLPSRFDPVDWHAHELLFGFAPAVVCGFLLTAIPNWTGRLPVTGAPLGGLVFLWVIGRGAVLFGAVLASGLVLIADLAFLAALAALIAREIIAGKNWRNLAVLLLVLLLLVANGLFHLTALQGDIASQGIGFRLGAGALVLLIGLIGGRIIPSFTRNWLVKQNISELPTPFNKFDRAVLIVSVAAIGVWVVRPDALLGGVLLLLAGVLHMVRLSRWSGGRTFGQLLVLVLHIAYGFLPLGYLLSGAASLWPGYFSAVAGEHAWMVGVVAMMMLAVMTRASLGHSGRPLQAGLAEWLIFSAIVIAAVTRIWASFATGSQGLLHLSATCWIIAFGVFCISYGPMMFRPKMAPKKPSKVPGDPRS